MRFKFPWTKSAPEPGTESYLQMVGLRQGQIPQINDKNYSSAYTMSAWVFACVSSIASAVGSVPVITQKASLKSEWEIDTMSDLNTMLSYVNSDHDTAELLELTAGWLALYGNAYWHLLRPSDEAPPVAVRVLPGDMVEVKTGKGIRSNMIEGYQIKDANQTFLRDIDVVHFKSFSIHPLYGVPPIKPLESTINLFSALTQYKYALAKNGGLVPAILRWNKPTVNDKEREKLNWLWTLWHQPDNNGKPLILGTDSTYEPVGIDPDKMAALALSHETRETICGIYGVPPGVVGLLQDANYSNLRVQRKSFWTETVIPKYLRRIEGALNEQVAWQFDQKGSRYRVKLDTSGIEALQEDMKDKATTNAILIKSGQRTPNEVREQDGLEPLEGGDTLQLSSQNPSIQIPTIGTGG